MYIRLLGDTERGCHSSGNHTLRGTMYTDTAKLGESSVHGNRYFQIFTTDGPFTFVFPMKSKRDTPRALKALSEDVGVPTHLHSDNAPELVDGEFKRLANELGCRMTSTEPHSPWQNKAELNI